MHKFVPLLLCILLTAFTVARATKPAHTPAPDRNIAQKKSTAQKADAKALLNVDMSEAEENEVAAEEDASDDEGEDVNDADSGDAAGDEDTGDDDAGNDDAGDDGGDDGGE